MVQDNLRKKTTKGILWNGIHNFSMSGIDFLLMLFMARLLTPADYGTVGLLGVFISISYVFIDSGFATALIRKKGRTQTDLSTVFFFNIGMSCICYAILFLSSPFIAKFYERPELVLVLRVMAISLIISSLNTIQISVLNYTMQFKKQAFISITQTLISGLIGLILALLNFGVWALVLQSLSRNVLGLFIYWTTCNWKPSFVFSKKSFKELFGFGSKVLATRLLDSIYGSFHTIIIGKCFSPSALGNYSRAQHWASFPSTNLVNILQNVSFASLALIQDDNERLSNVYRKMIKTTCFVVFPAMFGLAAISHPLIIFTVGEKWEFCSQILLVISFSYMLGPICSLNTNLIQVKGRSDLTLKLSVIQKVLSVAVLLISVPYGILCMCYMGIITSILMLICNTYYTGKLINLGFRKQLKDITPSLILSTTMFVCVNLCISLFSVHIVQIVVGVIVGIIVYSFLAYLFKLKELDETILLLKGMINKSVNI